MSNLITNRKWCVKLTERLEYIEEVEADTYAEAINQLGEDVDNAIAFPKKAVIEELSATRVTE